MQTMNKNKLLFFFPVLRSFDEEVTLYVNVIRRWFGRGGGE